MSHRELSLVVPLYNERTTAAGVVSALVEHLRRSGPEFELVLVENGSLDGTGEEIRRLAAVFPEIKHVQVPQNQGYGLGVLTGLGATGGRTVGFMGGDGQISPEDACRVWEAARQHPEALVKARRVRRQDGWVRRWTSVGYNLLMSFLFGAISRDINGTPKFFAREWLKILDLTSRDWFLDAELLLKATALGKPVVEVDVSFEQRPGGRSHVRLSAVLEFCRNMVRYRFGPSFTAWRRSVV